MASKRHTITVLLVSLTISTGILVYAFTKRTTNKSSRFSSVVFSGLNGWGYDILVDDSVIIHQESIPSYGNGLAFPEKQQAQQAANLVLKKLKQGGGLPTLSRFELKAICPSLK